ncbi:MAG: hypothetical protein LBT19_01785 [Candidatus Nomurabacteria bacterium]|jgi:hypothetical protein|nr:hypothetical protein [Candidatus Nomurabacteria bacterium]
MKLKVQVLLGVAVVFVLALGANLNNYVNAEDQGATGATSEDTGLSVSPSIDKLGYLEPGETYTREITLVNSGDETRTFRVLTSSFWVEDEKYEVKWGVSESQYGKIASWTDIDPIKVHEVKAGEQYVFKYRISVPKNQAGGAQRLMVTINMGVTGGEKFINTETHINTLVFANIEGDVHSGAEIVSQNIEGFSFTPSINTISTLKNTGDVDLDVTYKVAVSNFFGGDEVYTTGEEKVLMTESARSFEQKWGDAPMLGIFRVKQEITLMGETHEFNGVTIICPLWLILAVVLIIVAIVVYLMYKQSARKRRARD